MTDHQTEKQTSQTNSFRLLLRDFDPAAAEIQKLFAAAFSFLQKIGSQPIHDKAAIAFRLDQLGVFQDLQMMRNRDQFGFEKLGNIAHRHFAVA